MAGSEPGFDNPSFSEHLAGLAPTLQQPADSSGYYLSSEHLQLLEKLEYLTRYSPYIQVVLGPTDSGKSTLLKQFLPEQDNDLVTCHIEPETQLSRQALVNSIYTQLNQNWQQTQIQQAPEEAIYSIAKQLHEDDRLLLVVVDDAENLDDDALTWLLSESRQNLPDGQHLRLVLFAAPILTQRLNGNRALRETIEQHCHFLEVPPFDNASIRAYVEHNHGDLTQRLSEAQWNNIISCSAGLPGRINTCLEDNNALQSKKSTQNAKKFKWTTPLILLAVLGLGLIAWLAPEYLLTEEESISVNLPIPAPEPEPVSLATAPTETQLSTPERAATDPAMIAIETEPFTEATSSEPVSDAQVAELIDSLKEETPADETTEELEPKPSGKLALQLPPLATQQSTGVTTAKEAATSSPTQTLASQTGTTKPTLTTTPTPNTSTPVATSTATAKTYPASVTALSKAYLKEEELLSWKSDSYTLQMLGARQEKSVVEFIQSQSDREKMYYFATEFKEKPWYVVVYGNYPDRKAAHEALRSLPAELKKYKPWPRSAEGIQEDIHRVRP